ncbi:hypothetical protein PF005_g26942 [Phytophthora fragariae]|uniref:Uncharacterized protein n=1 Tax=Phytophthora fragariae TaxID=53985 RepID=A0A6A3VTH0_9STRA|nr:hypothetical protein PF011_g29748 [Phytophthora fragariae]KAE9164698.1 hypothetical protein PF004_g29743 [Phytophthora fragariae]KAE9171931.1 hypothetical protein PF005_g26942 [Phytophthora fragariae]KAE9175410.1 hypothetical protein PF002_g28797 [Phytophthora fragariae]
MVPVKNEGVVVGEDAIQPPCQVGTAKDLDAVSTSTQPLLVYRMHSPVLPM